MQGDAAAFLSKATGVVRNPIGIIALFIGLIYATATVVSGASPHLTDEQRWVLVIFAGAFPFVVLGTFFVLVTKHHSKLYAPSDWRDERLVFGPQSTEVMIRRLESEVQELVESEPDHEQDERSPAAVSAELEPVKPANPTRLEMVAKAREAEELAFQRLTKLYPHQIYRNVQLDKAPRPVTFDGLISEPPGRPVAFEVKFVRHIKHLKNRIDDAISNGIVAATTIKKYQPSASFELVLVLVTDGMSPDERRKAESIARDRLENVRDLAATVVVFDLDQLREEAHDVKHADSEAAA